MGKIKKENKTDTLQQGLSRNKLFIASGLLIAVLILGYFYFRNGKPEVKHLPETKGTLPQPAELIAGIDSVLREFGIENKWITDVKENSKLAKNSPQLWFSKEAKLPVDLPSTNVNLELTSFFKVNNLLVRTFEDPRSKNLRMDVLSSGDTIGGKIGQIRLSYSDSVKRKSSDVCIILDSIEHLSLTDAGKIINSGEEFSVIMPLLNDKADYQSLIADKKRDYLIELTYGSEESYEADFREGMSEKDWRSKIRSLCLNFPSASGIILRGKSLPSGFGNSIKEEFEKFGMNVYADTSFIDAYFNSAKSERIISDLENRSSSGSAKIVMITSLSTSEYEELMMKLSALRKRGFRFMEFKEISKKIIAPKQGDSTSTKPKQIQKKK